MDSCDRQLARVRRRRRQLAGDPRCAWHMSVEAREYLALGMLELCLLEQESPGGPSVDPDGGEERDADR